MVKSRYVTIRLPIDVETALREKASQETRTLAAQILHYCKFGLMIDDHAKGDEK